LKPLDLNQYRSNLNETIIIGILVHQGIPLNTE
jgi:hypothetical protein